MLGDLSLISSCCNGCKVKRRKNSNFTFTSFSRFSPGRIYANYGSKEKENEKFNHYLKKSFNKTASLISFSCKAVAHLANASEDIMEIAFQYGKNCGIAFQLIDDMLDFTSTATSLGKPNLNDLKSGLATAPVLFACEKFLPN
ncbi:hypothetical protein Avbf_10611 [Armadillidium vulgare]|nr:hypothetical protein Avbf_10611 [Armadillidium vulgare]